MTQFKDAYHSEDHCPMSFNDMWVKFKTGFVEAVERFIPSKMTKTKYSVPWIYVTLKRLVEKRHKGDFKNNASISLTMFIDYLKQIYC